MEVLMLGWEYPPIISGGLGIASQGLAEALSANHSIDFLLPKLKKGHQSKGVKLMQAENSFRSDYWKEKSTHFEKLNFLEIGVELLPYVSPRTFERTRTEIREKIELSDTDESRLIESIHLTGDYSEHLQAEVKKYALIAAQLSSDNDYELVHCHDWMSFPAGIAVKKTKEIPFIAHVHSTEFDRNPDFPDRKIVDIENEGLVEADLVFVVSDYIKKKVRLHYNIEDSKIRVVPNGFSQKIKIKSQKKSADLQFIGFAGRFVHQKNPLRFVDIAREISNKNPKARFLMAGDGYLMKDVQQKLKKFNLTQKFILPGFISNKEMLKNMSIMDALIMPSFSEPFGLVALEALQMNTPVISSTNAGIIEFVPSIPAFEQWDVFSFVETTLRILEDNEYKKTLLQISQNEIAQLSWTSIANQITEIYKEISQ